MLKLFRGQESSHQHEGREPLQSQGNRRGLVSAASRETPRWGDQERKDREVSEHYLREYDIITQGQRNKRYVDGQHWRCRGRLVPFFGNLGISEITAGKIQDYRIYKRITGYVWLPGEEQHNTSK